MILGGGELAWVSDYASIYLVDAIETTIDGVDRVPNESFDRGYHVFPNALLIYTADCLRQEIHLRIYDSEPQEPPMSPYADTDWTKIATTTACFPSKRLAVSSPSSSGGEAYAPQFALPARDLHVGLYWLEFPDDRYDVERSKADVIEVHLWPM